jgi:hypothetical protein
MFLSLFLPSPKINPSKKKEFKASLGSIVMRPYLKNKTKTKTERK